MAKRGLAGRPRRRACAIVRAAATTCWLCGTTIDKTLDVKHPMSFTVDEVIPRSHGGSTTDLRNLRAAHRSCNSRRGNRPPQISHADYW